MAEELKALDDSEFYDEFAKWWEDDGQYVRAGGGDYERSFAFQAFRHLMPQIAALRAQLPSQGGEAVEVVAYLCNGGTRVLLATDKKEAVWNAGHPLMEVAQHQRILAAIVADPGAVAVRRELLERAADRFAKAQIFDYSSEIRALLANSEGVKP